MPLEKHEPSAGVAPRRHTTARALLWTLLESFGLSGLSVITLLVLSRYVSPTEFGLASIALAVVQMAVVIADRLFHDPLIQRHTLTASDINSAFSATLLISLVLTLGCWFAAPWLAQALGQQEVVAPLRWMSLAILAAGVSSVLIAVHRREMSFRALALRSLLGRMLATVMAMALAVWGAGLWSIVAQQVLSSVLAAVALWWFSAVARPRLGWDRAALHQMLALGIPSTLQQFISIGVARLFLVLAALHLSVAAIGLMALAFRAVDMFRDLLAQAISQLALPMFARIEREGGDRRSAYITAVRLSSSLLLPVFAGLAVLSAEVVELAFGSQWLDAAPLVSLLSLLTFHYFPRQFATPLFGALGRPAAPLLSSAVQLSFIVLVLWLWPQATPLAVLAVWACRLLFSTPIDMWMLKRLSGIGYIDQWRGAFAPLLACLALAACIQGLRHWPALAALDLLPRLLLLAAAGAVAYVLALGVLKRSLLGELKSALQHGLRRGGGR